MTNPGEVPAPQYAEELRFILDTYTVRDLGTRALRSEWQLPVEESISDRFATSIDMLRDGSRLIGRQEGWTAPHNPKEVIDTLIDELPDSVPVYPAALIHDVPRSGPSNLEMYFAAKLPDERIADYAHIEPGSLSAAASINCLRDKVRTKLFLRALSDAIAERDASTDEPIEVCDAGTGAIPVLAIYAALSSDKVRCTALELNPESAKVARHVIREFGLEDRITVTVADATTYIPDKPVDVLVSETMHTGLIAEPIVQILGNLQRYVKPDGVTLPSAVQLKAAVVPQGDFEYPSGYRKYFNKKHVAIEPNWQDIGTYYPGDDLAAVSFELDTSELSDGAYHVAVSDEVVLGSHVLRLNDSLITAPHFLSTPHQRPTKFTIQSILPARAVRYAVSYAPGSNPIDAGKLIYE